jgi:hypothetical protein
MSNPPTNAAVAPVTLAGLPIGCYKTHARTLHHAKHPHT